MLLSNANFGSNISLTFTDIYFLLQQKAMQYGL
jgi:hypothetical protein